MTRAGPVVLLLISASSQLGRAQLPELRGYYLNVGVAANDGPFSAGGVVDIQRLRVMAGHTVAQVVLDAAYEHFFSYSSAAGAGGFAGGLGQAGGGEWLPLQGTITSSDHVSWRHRVDRVSLAYSTDVLEVTAGRQTISWATTLFLTPADPFAPFDPAEPFREYRAGVDAARLRAFPGPFSEVDVVVRPADTPSGTTVTALARGRATLGSWELAAWAGVVHEEASASIAATATVADALVRGEIVLRRAAGETVTRLALGVDRSFIAWGRNLYLVLEYQRDGFGAADSDELIDVVFSEPAQRGELQVFGRNTAALQGSYEVHPLVSVSVLTLVNLNDPSALFAPAASYSVGNEVTAQGGLFIGLGSDVAATNLPGSEWGVVPTSGYLSLTVFF